ncbi:putative protein FAM10A4 [Chelonus insularis]|uniref:putative protein FAM10A4 n=1 Tax=Chelonus insularis TaxID=460826 RepID=UPI00158F1FBE|nr:putative protein FAM10A4 [Chelonus insularis]
MSTSYEEEKLSVLREFFEKSMKNPEMLNSPQLSFVKEFIEHFGGHIPEKRPKTTPKAETKPDPEVESEKSVESEPESEESELELDNTGVIEPDNDPPQEMGDLTLEPSEEAIAEAQGKRSEAVSAFVEKDYAKAIQLYTEAIKLNPQAALLYAKRGQIFLLQNKPNACIRDCNRAIELNPDSAAAHKFRGRANQLLGKWEEAAQDLRLACKIDFDEQADEWLREVTPNARKIEEHKRKMQRKMVEKAAKQREEALKKAQKEASKAHEQSSSQSTPFTEGASGNKPFISDFYQYLKDPEVAEAFQDPEVSAAFMDISSNSANIFKYQKNPKIMNLVNKVLSKFVGGGGGMAGGMPGFFPGATNTSTPPTSGGDDVGLD